MPARFPAARRRAPSAVRIRRRVALALLVGLVGTAGCAPEQRLPLARSLQEQLVEARAALVAGQADDESCPVAGHVRGALFGEPGVDLTRQPWLGLRLASDNLLAACGQRAMATWPGQADATLAAARERWQTGAEDQLGEMCRHLRTAAQATGDPVTCEP